MATLKDRIFLPMQSLVVSSMTFLVGYFNWPWFLYHPVEAVLCVALLLVVAGLLWFYAHGREMEDNERRGRLWHTLAIIAPVLGVVWLGYVLAMPYRFPNAPAPDAIVRISGSTTLGEYLIPQYVQAMLARNNPVKITTASVALKNGVHTQIDADFAGVEDALRPDPEFKGVSAVRFIIDAQGSQAGWEGLKAGNTDLAMVTDNHKFNLLGDEIKQLSSVSIGKDAVAIIVNRNNPLAELDHADLQAIFRGDKAADWQVFFREKSGTTAELKEYLGVAEIKGNSVVSNIDMLNGVARNEKAIGYVSFSFLDRNPGVKAVAVKREGKVYAAPARETIRAGACDPKSIRDTYLYGRDQVATSADSPTTRLADLLLHTIAQEEWQDFVRSAGFFATADICPSGDACSRPVGESATASVAAPQYADYQQQEAVHTLTFAANGNIPAGEQLQALDAWAAGLAEADRKKPLILFGHSDSKGGALYNRGLSMARAEWAQKALEKHQLSVAYIYGLGADHPAKAGDSRRVEIYFQ